jgi:hypothetical protein
MGMEMKMSKATTTPTAASTKVFYVLVAPDGSEYGGHYTEGDLMAAAEVADSIGYTLKRLVYKLVETV